MTAIFISHSSADNEAAEEMKTWLEEQDHTSLFLDFDPDAGIRAGGDWEQTLYRELRQCQAVIALLTPSWLASKWCFAELVQAREKGKAIFPVKVQPCDAGGVFGDIQHLDLTAHTDEGYRRLDIGLRERGLDPGDAFDRDPKRPLYPGLEAFKEADAAIFFGRSEEILKGLETLDALRRRGRGAPRFALFLGASGSGKSSLVRAGLIPRLQKTPSEWLPVTPFRPQDDPLVELALALAHQFKALGQPRDWGEIRETLKTAAEQEPADGKVLLALARELCEGAEQREATVVLTIDQAEELFGYSTPEAAARFLRLLRAALEASDRQLMAMATLRSDFLGEFQLHRTLHDPAYDHDFAYQALPVDPMPERNFVEIIRGPAKLVELQLEDGLVEAMVRDTGTRDALPLLAFTLRRLYERYAKDGLLELREYEEIGRLEGAIRAEAERVLKEAAPSPEDLNALRAAFVPTMVRINADGGYARRRAYADDIPPRAKKLLGRFVDARLLVSDRDKDGRETLEVSHEALLRTWPQLTDWLAEDQDKLRVLESLHRAAADWDNAERPDDLLVHRDGRLQDAEALITNRRFAVQENSLEKRYLDACVEGQHAREAAEREEQERRVRDAERIAEEQKKAAVAQKKTAQRTRVGLVIALVLALAAGWQYLVATENAEIAKTNEELAKKRELEAQEAQKEAEEQARIALSRQLSAQAIQTAQQPNEFNGFFDRALLLAVQALQVNRTPETRGDLLRVLQSNPDLKPFPRGVLRGHEGEVQAVAFSPDGETVASAGLDGTVRLWDVATGAALGEALRGHEGEVQAVAFSPDGETVASAGWGTVRLWDVATGAALGEALRGHEGETVTGVAFSPDGETVASAGMDGTVRLWDVATGAALGEALRGHEEAVYDVAFSPDGETVASAGVDGTVRLWDVATGAALGEALRGHEEAVEAVAFSPDGETVASAGLDVRLWDVATGAALGEALRGHEGEAVTGVAFSPDGETVASAGVDGTVRLWDVATGAALGEALRGHEEAVEAVAFSPDGETVASAGMDWTVRLWDVASRKALGEALRGHEGDVEAVAFSPDGETVASAGWDGTVRLWDVASRKALGEALGEALRGHYGNVEAVAFSPDGETVASAGVDGTVQLWDVATGAALGEALPGLTVTGVAFSPDGETVASEGPDGTVRLWDVASRKALGEALRGHEGEVQAVAFSPDGETVASAGWGTVRLWDVATGAALGEALRGHEGEAVTGVAFSPDGETVASAGWDGTVRLWDVATGAALGEALRGHEGKEVEAVAFSPDGETVASAGWDGTVRLWDVASRKALGEALRGHERQVHAVAFSPDGETVASAGWDGTVRLWDVDFQTRACRIAARNLTCSEWRQYLGDKPYQATCPDLPAAEDCD